MIELFAVQGPLKGVGFQPQVGLVQRTAGSKLQSELTLCKCHSDQTLRLLNHNLPIW
jgi:hypothetical protein